MSWKLVLLAVDLIGKLFTAIGKLVGAGFDTISKNERLINFCKWVINPVLNFIIKTLEAPPKVEEPVKEDPVVVKANIRQAEMATLLHCAKRFYYAGEVDIFLESHYFVEIPPDEVKQICLRMIERRKEREKAQEEREVRRKEFVLFWVNFSQLFAKFAFYIFYAIVGSFAIWLTFNYGLTALSFGFYLLTLIWEAMKWCWSIPFWSVFKVIALGLIGIGIIASAIFGGIFLIKKFQKPIMAILNKTIPLGILDSAITTFIKFMGTQFDSFVDFIKTFTLNLCPKIEITEDDE